MDALEALVPKERMNEYLSMMKELEKEFNLEWEHEEYIKLYYLNINNYIALTNNGKVKRKGEFKIEKSEIPLGDSTDFLIIPKIINKYLIDNPDNKSVEELLMNWKELGFSIYDFCASFKVDKSYSVFHNRIKQQQLNRYYASKHKDSAYLIKIKNTELPNEKQDNINEFYIIENINGVNTKVISINRWNTLKKNHMLKDSGVMLFNKYVELEPQEYKINYQFYQSKINELLYKLQHKQDLFS